jgi:hypothetical protein
MNALLWTLQGVLAAIFIAAVTVAVGRAHGAGQDRLRLVSYRGRRVKRENASAPTAPTAIAVSA